MSGRGGRGQRGGYGQRGGRGHNRSGPGGGHGRSRGGGPKDSKQARVKETEEQRQVRKSYSSWKRRLGESPKDATTMRRLWEGAVGILEAEDRDWRQQLPQDLDDDEGHPHILSLLSLKVVGTGYDTFIVNARNFLLTITHSSLLRCLAVDTHVGSIYNLFSGVGGKRAVLFLQRVCEALQTAPPVDSEAEATLLATSVALFELLRRERRARFNDDIPALVESIDATANALKDGVSSESLTRIANRLNDVRALVARAQDLLASDNHNAGLDADIEASFYPRDLIVPSGRYDNDKKDIADLVIFPTRDEITSDVKEFLPYTDPDQPHFLEDPVQRHIDTYFRLLRHDIFGELKSALAGVMHIVGRDPTALNDPRLHLGDKRSNQYLAPA